MTEKSEQLYRLRAVSVADGRYAKKTDCVGKYLSEAAYIIQRLKISANWFNYIVTRLIPNNGIDFNKFTSDFCTLLRHNEDSVLLRIKEIEEKTNHDVQAIIDFLKEFYLNGQYGDPKLISYIHHCLTSQDLNTSGIKVPLRNLIENEFSGNVMNVRDAIERLINSAVDADTSVMGITHGQPAVIVTMRNVLIMFRNQISKQLMEVMQNCETLRTKFGGATGGFNSLKMVLKITDRNFDVNKFADDFCNFASYVDMERNPESGQTDSYIDLANLIDSINVLNRILKKICADVWNYISREYFKIKPKEGEVGSSAMPHKVNPIDFENAEANLQMAIDIGTSIESIVTDLRMQRDLRDSTALRNLGGYFGYCVLAYGNIVVGFSKLSINVEHTAQEIKEHPEIYSEAIQICLRTFGSENGYNMLKELTRGKKITIDVLLKFVEEVPINEPFVAMYYPHVTIDDIRTELRLLVTEHATHYAPVTYQLM